MVTSVSMMKTAKCFIRAHPSLVDALVLGVVNYSKLARLIISKSRGLSEDNFEALVSAVRRISSELSDNSHKGLNTVRIRTRHPDVDEVILKVKNSATFL